MDANDNAFGSFLASRRAKITPEQVGLPAGGRRRVEGLRRGELAMLAGISVEYLARLERGVTKGASDQVLESLAGVLRLDDAEREHLMGLASTAGGARPRRPRKKPQVLRPNVQLILESVQGVPAVVRNGRTDFLAMNDLARALFSEMVEHHERPLNHARFIFLDPRSRTIYPDWAQNADDMVGVLIAEAGRNPFDRDLTDLVGELSTRSDEFRTRWASQNVRHHNTGRKQFDHRVVGHLDLNFESLLLTADEGLWLMVYPATPGSPSADGLELLAASQATPDGAALPLA